MAVAPPPPSSGRMSQDAHMNQRSIAEELLAMSVRLGHLAVQVQNDADTMQDTIKRLAEEPNG